MAHPNHDAIVDAFIRVDPACRTCDRGDPAVGYTHIHGPSQACDPTRCTTHTVTVEKTNGTVSLRRPLGAKLGGNPRTGAPISQDPMGYSVRSEYGDFDTGFTFATIQTRWQNLDDFARDVIASLKALPRPW